MQIERKDKAVVLRGENAKQNPMSDVSTNIISVIIQ